MLKTGWGILSSTWWALLKARVSKPTLNQTQPLAKPKKNPTQKCQAQSVATDCTFKQLKIGGKNKKWWKMGKMGEIGMGFRLWRHDGGGDGGWRCVVCKLDCTRNSMSR
jgi:hypothetical protein